MQYVSGLIYQNGEFAEGYLGFKDGIIREVGKGSKSTAIAKGVIIPTFVNAHTHIGDSIIKTEPKGSIEELIAPPNGLKFKILRASTDAEIINAMRSTVHNMWVSGISQFCDFREDGLRGIAQIEKALAKMPINTTILGRPRTLEYSKPELNSILERTNGIGVSSISDWDFSVLKKISKLTKDRNKIFALHASERIREDIDKILDLKPDFLVHMIKATPSDLKLCAENNVPIVVCSRANAFFGLLPNIPKMIETGLTLALGTDNVMLSSPSMFKEMEFAYRISKLFGSINAEQILDMTVLNPRKVLNPTADISKKDWENPLREGNGADFVVFNIPTHSPAYHIVTRGCRGEIDFLSMGKYTWKRDKSSKFRMV